MPADHSFAGRRTRTRNWAALLTFALVCPVPGRADDREWIDLLSAAPEADPKQLLVVGVEMGRIAAGE